MDGQVTAALLFQVVGGVMLTGCCGGVGYLLKGYIDMGRTLAGLEARVEANQENSILAFGDTKQKLTQIDGKMDRLMDRIMEDRIDNGK